MMYQVESEPFDIRVHQDSIVLSGDLDGSDFVWSKCEQLLGNVSQSRPWMIQAHDAYVLPGGVDLWIEIVQRFLNNCTLVYTPSQLNLVLRTLEEYRHPATTFLEYGEYEFPNSPMVAENHNSGNWLLK